jgi:phage tail-like protein
MAGSSDLSPLLGFRYSVSIVDNIEGAAGERKKASASQIKSSVSDSNEVAFSEISGFSATLETEDIEAGGENMVGYNLPKQVTYSPLVLKRGMLNVKSDFFEWINKTLFGETSKPLTTKTVVVKLLDATSEDPLLYWVFNGAFPSKWSTSGFKALNNELAIEELEIKYRSFYPVLLG